MRNESLFKDFWKVCFTGVWKDEIATVRIQQEVQKFVVDVGPVNVVGEAVLELLEKVDRTAGSFGRFNPTEGGVDVKKGSDHHSVALELRNPISVHWALSAKQMAYMDQTGKFTFKKFRDDERYLKH